MPGVNYICRLEEMTGSGMPRAQKWKEGEEVEEGEDNLGAKP